MESNYKKWRIYQNREKTKALLFQPYKRAEPRLHLELDDHVISWSQEATYLGLQLDAGLAWKHHTMGENRRHHPLLTSSRIPLRKKLMVYKSCIRPIAAYRGPLWSSAATSRMKTIEAEQNRALRNCLGIPPFSYIYLLVLFSIPFRELFKPPSYYHYATKQEIITEVEDWLKAVEWTVA
ncbi:hypothetical protein J437_LFUL008247 [Ladona fulva]|uniref:Uncharacterized protein n=1 Tax=Ladona fulva TaxID=123851 RepID=A0A8K0K7Q4_LADFU|nr:hypothetical protein J437_LFUL008247 [Ladona fulva]